MGETLRVRVRGTAGAWPIPRPACACPQCAEARADPRLARTRSGLEVRAAGEVAFVDAGPDVARQMERDSSARVDRLLVTHTHADHFLGLDDLVHLREGADGPMAVHAAPWHRERISAAFAHLLRPGRERISFDEWEAGTRLAWGGIVLEGFETGHRTEFPTTGVLVTAGERRIAYATDMGVLPEETRARLRGVDLFVGDGTYLGAAGHGHPGSGSAVAQARSLGARRIALTHVGHWRVTAAEARAVLGDEIVVLRDGDDLLAI